MPVIGFSDAERKTELFRERYSILHQRTSRHDLFTKRNHDDGKQYQLRNVEFLLGTSVKQNDVIVLGLLTGTTRPGKFALEDPTGVIDIDIAEAKFHKGLFTENCFVLAEGSYEDRVFKVSAMGFPPPESADVVRAHFGNNIDNGLKNVNDKMI